ncbi:MAG: hypothetical protein UH103_04350 [Paludibacteraceae bacterium]|jgi:hypothetical protein|nr:hypothetical protein [Paludibacteraceae bacterium]
MAKKFNLSKGLAGRLTGGLIGGAASAVWDKYVVPMFGDTLAGYENYAKVALGAVLPAVVKGNQMVDTIGDSLIAIGANNIVAGLLEETPAQNTPGTAGVPMVNAGRYPGYRRFVAGTEQEKQPMVNSGVK